MKTTANRFSGCAHTARRHATGEGSLARRAARRRAAGPARRPGLPGGAAVQLVRVEGASMSAEEVQEQRMRDRIFNVWDEERRDEVHMRRVTLGNTTSHSKARALKQNARRCSRG